MFIVYDIETTGLSTLSDDIIQFSYIRYDDNNVPLQAETLYYYYEGMHWSPEAEAVHHIPLSLVKQHADKFEENVVKMYSLLSLANVVGYNSNAFDNIFVRNWLNRMGMPNLNFGMQKDIMLLARPVVHKPRISLAKLCDKMELTPDIIRSYESMCFKHEGTQSHSASYDVAATALIAFKFLRDGHMTWKYGKTDPLSNSSNIFDIDEIASDGLPIDKNAFYVKFGEEMIFCVTDKDAYSSRPDSSKPYPILNALSCVDGVYDFGICKLSYESGELYSTFPYGKFKVTEFPFDKLLQQLKVGESDVSED